MKLELDGYDYIRRKPALSAFVEIPKSQQWLALTVILILHDSVMVYLAFQLAYFIRFNSSLDIFKQDVVPSVQAYNILIAVFVLVWVLFFGVFGLYQRQNLLMGTREASLIFNAVSVSLLLVIAIGFYIDNISMARGWITLAWIISFFFTALGRYLLRLLVRKVRSWGYLISPALLVGANGEGRLLMEQLLNRASSGLQIVGFIDETLPAGTAVEESLKVLGNLDTIDAVVQQFGIEEIIVVSSALEQNQITELFTKYGVSEDINIRLSTGLYQVITTGLQVHELAGVPLVKINKVRLTGLDQVEKFLTDYVIAIPAALALLPLFLILWVLIQIDSRGPVIYRRRVMGVNGKQFDAYKFRTMFVNGNEILAEHPELKEELDRTGKLKDDPRITRVGKLLRKTSLDELPQIINVLKNEMSIVGPRMISPPEMSFYNQLGMNLLTVKPGITGLWQVSGRSDVAYEERVRLDMYYIRNWSIWLDLQLLFKTIPAVLQHRGAY